MSKRVKIEINHQDRSIPIYTIFKDVKEGLVVLFGNNEKTVGWSLGKISDGRGNEVSYGPKGNMESYNAFKKLKRIPKGSKIWLLGEFRKMKLAFYRGGSKEEFERPDLLE